MSNVRNILIIDDSTDMRSLLKLILETKGYHADCSSNGEEALTILNSSDKLPDLILLDLRMPVMDGLEFLKLQRQNPRIQNIPVVVMTGEEDAESMEDTQGSKVLMKPFDMNRFLATIQHVL